MKEVKKISAKKAPAKSAVTRKVTKSAAVEKSATASKAPINPEERYKMIQEAAYYIAERHGFNGDSAYFWSQAEAEINSRFS